MKTAVGSPDDDFNRKKPGGGYQNASSEGSHVPYKKKTGLPVPDRSHDPRRKVNFYTSGDMTPESYSHSADVRWVGKKHQHPHAGDIKKNTKDFGGNHGWEVADHTSNRPLGPSQF